MVVPDAKVGLNVPLLNDNAESVASFEILVTVTVYVLVERSCAVTKTSIVLVPAFKLNALEALPLVTLL